MFPMYLIQSAKDIEESKNDKIAYLIGCNGVFIRKQNVVFDVVQALFKPEKERYKISGLEKIEGYCVYRLPNFDKKTFGRIIGFFREVYKLHSSEALLYIFYNPETKEWDLKAPAQEVNAASVEQKEEIEAHEGFKLIGSVHSHGGMSAFHSGTDHEDQGDLDGFHLTIGNIDKHLSFDAKLYCNGVPYTLKEEYYLPEEENFSFPKDWLDKVTKKTAAPTTKYIYTPGGSLSTQKKTNGIGDWTEKKEEREKAETELIHKVLKFKRDHPTLLSDHKIVDDLIGIEIELTPVRVIASPTGGKSYFSAATTYDLFRSRTDDENTKWLKNILHQIQH